MKNKKQLLFITAAAIIAAAYVVLTLVSAALGIAYGPVQFRLSEVLCILPVFTPAAIPGLTIGCIIANISSFNAVDMIFGSLATLTAAVFTYLTRNVRLRGIPLLAFSFPVLLNAVIVGLEITMFFLPSAGFWTGFAVSALQVGLGEAVICFGLGIPLYGIIKKRAYKLFDF